MYSYPNCQRTIKWIINPYRYHIKSQSIDFSWIIPTFINFLSIFRGGGERARTDGLLRARQALSQLSYTPNKLVRILKFESAETLNGYIGRIRFFDSWWAWMELNHRPHAYQACALTKLSYRPWGFSILPNWKSCDCRDKMQDEPIIHFSENLTWSLKTK